MSPRASGPSGERDLAACGCEEAINRLFEFLDAEVSDWDRRRIEAHIAGCASCDDAASAERHVRALLRRSCREAAPESLRLRVVAQLVVGRIPGRLASD